MKKHIYSTTEAFKNKPIYNGIWWQRYELSKQLQYLQIDVALLSETHLKSHERFFIANYHFHRTDRFPERKDGTAIAVIKTYRPASPCFNRSHKGLHTDW
jgi:hypothetical protein